MSPKVSILTATYNSLPGLQETVASVASQTASDYEHIVIDGGSTDGTREWLESYEGDLRWISEPDEGIADALNKGIETSLGGWLLVLHAEDTFLDSSSLERALTSLETTADIVCFDVLFVTQSGSKHLVSKGFVPQLNFKNTFRHQGVFSRRALFDGLGVFDSSFEITMDYEFFLRAERAGAHADVTHEIITVMPNTGVSSALDWPTLRQRFGEERRAQAIHCRNPGLRFVYAVYTPMYLAYRRVRYLFARLRDGAGVAA